MTHYKYWKDDDGYIRAATWDDRVNVIEMARFDPITKTRCYSVRFFHRGPGAAEKEFYSLPDEETESKDFCSYMGPLMEYKLLGGELAELLKG